MPLNQLFSNKKAVIISVAAILVVIALLTWLFIESTKPLPGQKQQDEGRGHVPIGTEVKYKTNIPTSGQHYEDWTRAGIYDQSKDDRNLVHSLEHGYIVMYFKCGSVNPTDLEASSSAKQADQCQQIKDHLVQIYNSKGPHKLIVVPRANLDTNFSITAWDYLDNFNDFDKGRVEKFIDAHRDQGPEQTMEP